MTALSALFSASTFRFLLAIGVAVLGVWSSISFLSATLAPAIGSVAVLKAGDGTGLDFVANPEPIPAGTVSALSPLPQAPAKAAPVTLPATSAPVTTASVVPAAEAGDDSWRVLDGVNVRRDASSKSAVVGTLERGAPVRVLDTRRGWMLVEYKNGIRGWVYGRFLQQDAAVAAAE